MAPGGNGGVYEALQRSELLERPAHAGLKWVLTYAVDNALLPLPDFAFVGAVVEAGFELGTKAVRRSRPGEKVGLLVHGPAPGAPAQVREYVELAPDVVRHSP